MDGGDYPSLLTTIASLSLAILGYVGAMEVRKVSIKRIDDRIVSDSIFIICIFCIIFSLIPLVGLSKFFLRIAYISMCAMGILLMSAEVASLATGRLRIVYPVIYFFALTPNVILLPLAILYGWQNYSEVLYGLVIIWYFLILLVRSWFFVSNLVDNPSG